MKVQSKKYRTADHRREKLSGYKNTVVFRQRQPDLYVILGCKIYPLHKTQVLRCGCVSSRVGLEEKVVMLQADLQVEFFQAVLEFLYGCDPKIQRGEKVQKMYKTAKILQVPQLLQIYHQDFNENFDEYSFFQLYKLVIKYEIPSIIQKCQQELLALEYEQINYNRADLLDLPVQIFEKVIKDHQNFKANKVITGLTVGEIREAIEGYEEYNGCKIDIEGLMRVVQFDCFEGQYNDQKDKDKIIMSQMFPKKVPENKTKRKSDSYFRSCSNCQTWKQKNSFQEFYSNKYLSENEQNKNETKRNRISCFKYEIEEIACFETNFSEIQLSLCHIQQNTVYNQKYNQTEKQIQREQPKSFQSMNISSEGDSKKNKTIAENSQKTSFWPEATNHSQNNYTSFNSIPKMQKDLFF